MYYHHGPELGPHTHRPKYIRMHAKIARRLLNDGAVRRPKLRILPGVHCEAVPMLARVLSHSGESIARELHRPRRASHDLSQPWVFHMWEQIGRNAKEPQSARFIVAQNRLEVFNVLQRKAAQIVHGPHAGQVHCMSRRHVRLLVAELEADARVAKAHRHFRAALLSNRKKTNVAAKINAAIEYPLLNLLPRVHVVPQNVSDTTRGSKSDDSRRCLAGLEMIGSAEKHTHHDDEKNKAQNSSHSGWMLLYKYVKQKN
jgi:hypothetical protein